jgi:NAD(P)-dependent dehydrogenase (short-subunit alcohol dehydrogenase family)
MVRQYDDAFRLLQQGMNTGKVVLRLTYTLTVVQALGTQTITGGTGGLGLVTARWLADNGASAVVLASRSGKPSAGAAHTELQRVCADVRVERCNASEHLDVGRLWTRTSSETQRGVWHAAGVAVDGLMSAQKAASLEQVYGAKVHGAWSISTACLTIPMTAFMMFSSNNGFPGGSRGSANYAAANLCLDSVARGRQAHGREALSVQWGAWGGVGMVADGALVKMIEASGFTPIKPDVGMTALQALLRPYMPSVSAFMPTKWAKVLGGGVLPNTPFYSAFAPKAMDVGAASAQGAAACGVSLEAVLEMVKRTAGGTVDADAPLMEAGVDSLGSVELRNQLSSAAGAGASLPSTLVFDHPTARQLASLLAPKQEASAASTANAPVCMAYGKAIDGAAMGGVAIDGLSARFPSGVSSKLTASCMVSCGSDAIVQVPTSRWDVTAQPTLPEPFASRVRHAGFVQGAELADNAAFSVAGGGFGNGSMPAAAA